MVDVVSTPTMPSENEVHVARSFLTKILRSSMRKNDPGLRPHSWHSSKLTEEESEPAGTQANPVFVWQPKHEAGPDESTTPGDQKTQQSNQLNSVTSMERLEHPSHPLPPGCHPPTKYVDSSETFSASGAKRDSAFSCFSGSSSPPVLQSSRKGTSTEKIFFKGLQSEGPQQNERHRYPQSSPGNGGWEGSRVEEQPASRVSVAGRPNGGLVWQAPEKKKSQSPPPPPLPLRSDSFAATKVFPYSEGPLGPSKNHGSSIEKLTETNQNCLRFQNQLHPNKLLSLSSSDVRQSHHAQSPAHQRQYSDESPFYLQTRKAPSAKTQSVGSYYRSLQDLPTNAFSRMHIRHSTAATAGCTANSSLESGGQNRHFGPASNYPMQIGEVKARQSKAGGWRGESEWMSSIESCLQNSLKANIIAKYPMPQSQMPCMENKDRNGNGQNYDHKTHKLSLQSPKEQSKRAEGPPNEIKRAFLTHQSNDHKVGPSRLQDPWVPQEDHRISALKTPLLHFLAQESQSLTERQSKAATKSMIPTQDACEAITTGSGKAGRRSDRYATTLRKEIKEKRAQLQKSCSAATLTCEAEDEEDAEEWRSMEASASSNTYKDHLKEAQARVLQATSFQRRDLEPLGPEAPVIRASYGRIRGRRRFHPAKRTHSFSEPDKIDKVGVDGESLHGPEQQRKFLENKPAFPRPMLQSSHGTDSNLNQGESNKSQETLPSGESDHSQPCTDPSKQSPRHKQILLELQRLGTFAEYQATWNEKKKSSEAKAQGRYHSAENILDPGVEEESLCIHERSRSSPSADFHTQNISPHWRDPQSLGSSLTTRETAGSRSPDHSPQGILPCPPDHRTEPDPAGHSLSSVSLNCEPKPPQTQSLLPPPRLHLGPETTSCSKEFLAGAQPDPAGPGSASDSQNQAAALPSSGPAQHVSPHLIAQSGAGAAESKEQEEWTQPSSSSPSSSSPSAALGCPGPDQTRSPSPQFAPLRLTDKPPGVSGQDDLGLSSKAEPQDPAGMDVSSPVRKVPIRIVHTGSERRGQAYLPQSAESSAGPTPSAKLTAERTAPSLFSAYTRPEPLSAQESGGPRNLEPEDAKREELVRDIMGRDKSLMDILDQSGRRTTMDLMEGLFPPEERILEGVQLRRRASVGSRPSVTSRREAEDASLSAPLVPSSSYYNTSAPKAELLIKMKDMQEQLEDQDSEDELDVDLASKKQELISSLAKKLEVLREARQSLQEDVEDNETLGREVEATVQRLCQSNQLDKFRMFVGDLDKVVSLLLSLSGRLARVENALNSLEDEAPLEEKRTLTEKRELLMRQHDDAKELKENLDRRERLVTGIMEAHLDAESLADYRHFVKMKSALIIEQRKLEDKIKLGEEQLKCLMESLPPEQRQPPPEQRPPPPEQRSPLSLQC